MTTQDIVGKLWNLCNVLKDDGVTYHQYVTELTYLLFLKWPTRPARTSSCPRVTARPTCWPAARSSGGSSASSR
jgi:hypothetical protein